MVLVPPKVSLLKRYGHSSVYTESNRKIVLHIADYAHLVSGKSNLCLAGGVALNCVANGRIRSEGKFDSIWIQPAGW